MYIPNSKISRKTTSNKAIFILKANHKPYKGPYIETTNGKFYAGHNNNKVGAELIKKPLDNNNTLLKSKNFGLSRSTKTYNIINEDIKSQIKNTISPSTSKPAPTEKDYNKGFFLRYFLKRINSKFYIEVNKATYDSLYKRENKYDYNLYEIGSVKWYITGNNIHALNSKNLKTLSKKHKNIALLFPILNEYLRADTKVQENLMTHGGELYYSSGKEYIGPYHLHPVKGPMEGATHTSTPHANLYYFKQLPKINNQDYNKFLQKYDKIKCYKCIGTKFGNKIVSQKISSLAGCPSDTYSLYEDAVNACPSSKTTEKNNPSTNDRESGY